jgi:hypothetical protein
MAMFPPPPPRTDDVLNTVNFRTGVPPAVTKKPALFALDDAAQDNHRKDIVNGFCGAFGGTLPQDFPDCVDYPPFTRLIHTGQEQTTGWYTVPVTITLVGINVSGKGIDHTEYQIGSQNFIRYSSPFPLAEGVSTVFYRSEDQAGTFEVTKQTTFKIDTIPPQTSFVTGQPQYAPGPPIVVSSTTPFTLTGTDLGSGMFSVSYRFYLEGAIPIAYTVITGSSAHFTISGPDGVYQIDYQVLDVAGNLVAESQKIRLSHVADLAITDLQVVTPPPPFVVVETPIQLTVRTTISNLGFVNPVDTSLRRTVADTIDVTVTPKDTTETDAALGLNQPRVRDQIYTVACQRRSTNSLTFTSEVTLAGSPPGTIDNNLSNNKKPLSVHIICKVPWKPGVFYNAGDEVVFNGLVYVCRQSHTSQTGWEPPNTYALWKRIPVGDQWAAQVIYQTGDVVLFEGHHYRAIQGHQALDVWKPPQVPALWVRFD